MASLEQHVISWAKLRILNFLSNDSWPATFFFLVRWYISLMYSIFESTKRRKSISRFGICGDNVAILRCRGYSTHNLILVVMWQARIAAFPHDYWNDAKKSQPQNSSNKNLRVDQKWYVKHVLLMSLSQSSLAKILCNRYTFANYANDLYSIQHTNAIRLPLLSSLLYR